MFQIEEIKKNLRIPVIMAPMFLVSGPEMVMEACKSGIIGSFPALNARTASMLAEWMEEINRELDAHQKQFPDKKVAPWAINYITHRSNKRYVEDLELIERFKPPIVITSLGDPSRVAEIVHRYGGLVFSDVINIKYAKKAIEKGSDGLVLVSAGAGGHGGTYNPFAFIHEVRTFFDGPIALAGTLTKGEDILAAEILGADFAYIGTRFIPAKESRAQEEYKQAIADATIEDIIYTDAFSGINANYLLPSIVRAGLDPEKLKSKEKIDLSELSNSKAKAWKDIWGAGQGVGPIDKTNQTVEEIVAELEFSYKAAKQKIINKHMALEK